LVGIAHVVEIEDFASSFELSEQIGKIWSCYRGAVRLYWPGFDPKNQSRQFHPLWLADDLDSDEQFDKHLLSLISAVASTRIGYDPEILDIARAFRAEKESKRLEELRSSISPEWFEEMEGILKENDELKIKLQNMETQNQVLLSETPSKIYFEEWRTGYNRSISTNDKKGKSPKKIKNIYEALEMVDVNPVFHEKYIEVLDRAYDSARRSNYMYPDRILRGLLDIAYIAMLYHYNILTTGFLEAFQKLGQSFTPNVSDTAKGKYGSHYTFTWQGKKIVVDPHLRFGRGNPNVCARIYWYVEKEEHKFIICHVGEHLPDDTA
jgi:hypothetical protein